MRVVSLLSLASSALATQGFNYGAVKIDGSVKFQSDFQSEFSTAKSLSGTSGAFSSARLYTTIQAGTTNDPISAIPAAIAEGTTLLLGIWASSGQTTVDNEIAALKTAITKYGEKFTSLVVGLSVGSEDLYRITPTGLANDPNSVGAGPDTLVSYISQVRTAVKGTSLEGLKIGHVDTWTGWVNGSNSAVVDAVDWLGMNTFPYFQTTDSNGIDNGKPLFQAAYDATAGAGKGKPVWVTETGWPVGGKKSGQAEANAVNAKAYWDAVGCGLFGKTNTWWYTLVDANTDPTQPEFGIVGTTLSSKPLYDLSCDAVASTPSSSSTPEVSTPSPTSAQIPSPPSPVPPPASVPPLPVSSPSTKASEPSGEHSSPQNGFAGASTKEPTETRSTQDNPTSTTPPSSNPSTSVSQSSETPSTSAPPTVVPSSSESDNSSSSQSSSGTPASSGGAAAASTTAHTTSGSSGGSSTSASTSPSSSGNAAIALAPGPVMGGLMGVIAAVMALF